MKRYSIQPRKIKYFKVYSFLRNLSDRYEKKLLDIAIKSRLDAGKSACKKVTYKTAEITEELIDKKIKR